MRISDRERTIYRDQGFVGLDWRLEPAVVRQMRTALEDWARQSAPPGPHGILKNNLWREAPWVADLIHAGELAAVACELLSETRVVLFQDNLVWKSPGATRIEWHQDYSYWPLDAPTGVTFWIALDDADVDNGCLHYIPGTHHLGECQPAAFVLGAAQPGCQGLPPLDWRKREREAVARPVVAGEAVAHHPLVWHMSPPNESNRPRRALTLTWISAAVRWDPDHAPHPFNYRLDPRAGSRVEGELFPQFVFGDGGA
jgi:phytanoyl-CoA hydroxylase